MYTYNTYGDLQLNAICLGIVSEKKRTEIDCQGVIKFIACYKKFMVFIFTFYGILENQFQFIVGWREKLNNVDH